MEIKELKIGTWYKTHVTGTICYFRPTDLPTGGSYIYSDYLSASHLWPTHSIHNADFWKNAVEELPPTSYNPNVEPHILQNIYPPSLQPENYQIY